MNLKPSTWEESMIIIVYKSVLKITKLDQIYLEQPSNEYVHRAT